MRIELLFLGFVQVSTAIAFVLSTLFPDLFFSLFYVKVLDNDLAVYRYVISALYFSLGALFLTGAFVKRYVKIASLIAVIDFSLEIISYWFGFNRAGMPLPLILFFIAAVFIPSCFCVRNLLRK
jgi:hypothetical protein